MLCGLTTFSVADETTFLPVSGLVSLTIIAIEGVVTSISEECLVGFRLGFFEGGNRRSEIIDEASEGVRRAIASIAACWDILASVNEFVVEELVRSEVVIKAMLKVVEV